MIQEPNQLTGLPGIEQPTLFEVDEASQLRLEIDGISEDILFEPLEQLAQEDKAFRTERQAELGVVATVALETVESKQNGTAAAPSETLGRVATNGMMAPNSDRPQIQVVERALSKEEYDNMARKAEVAKKAATVEIVRSGRLTVASRPWRGDISANKLVTTPEQAEIVREAKQRINEFYVPVGENAPSRCVDGRFDDKIPSDKLGPQVPGGAPGAAVAYRLGVDRDDLTRGNFLDDVEARIDDFEILGLSPGVHTDEEHVGKNTIGCKFISDLNKVVSVMTYPELVDDHKRVVKGLMGPNFNRDNYLRVMGAATVLNGRSSDYFRGREEVLEKLAKRSEGSVSVLKGTHKEVLVAVNFVPETTFDSRGFAEEFDGYQAFGYDVWRSLKMAEQLLPRPDQVEDRERFVMARIMTTVSTLMALTDGSQELVLRLPGDSNHPSSNGNGHKR